MSDASDLSEFARTGSTDAFARLVAAHVNTVYSAARRQVRDAQLAEDVTQAVFIVLMRRAKSIRTDVPLIGWLLKTTYFASRDALKTEHRRRRHEQKAAAMKPSFTVASDNDISPELDRALARLGELDRGIIALRYLEEKTIPEIAGGLSISHEAATKRLTRALAKLRGIMLRRRTISAAIPIETFLAAVPRLLAPPHLAGASIAAATGVSITASTMIAKGAMQMMRWTWIKIAAVISVGLVIITVSAAATQTLLQGGKSLSAAPATATLQNGIVVELLGVGDASKNGPAIWWSPNGAPLPVPPYAHISGGVSSFVAGSIVRELAVRTDFGHFTGADEPSFQWHFSDASSANNSFAESSGTPQDAAGHDLAKITAIAVSLPDSTSGTNLHISIASDPWKTFISSPGAQRNGRDEGTRSILLSSGYEVSGVTHVMMSCSGFSSNTEDQRLIAIDTVGRLLPVGISGWQSAGNSQLAEFAIHGPLAQIKEVRFQTRPWNQWIEIRHISLHANHATQVEVVTSDQPGATAPK